MRAHDGRLRVWATLPDRYSNRQIAASTIDAHGRIVALVVDPDVECAQRGGSSAPYDATLVLVDGQDCHETLAQDLDLRFPKIDVLDDGFVLAAARCRMPSGPPATTFDELEAEVPWNALVLDAAGDRKAAFHVGDAIEHLMTDIAGTIWVGYFDEASICAPHPVRPSRGRTGNRPKGRMTMSTPRVLSGGRGRGIRCGTPSGTPCCRRRRHTRRRARPAAPGREHHQDRRSLGRRAVDAVPLSELTPRRRP